jgi:hypothetical protein
MTRLFVHVEGQTEEAFVNNVLRPHLTYCGFELVTATLLGSARSRSKRGGIKGWNSVRGDIVRHLKEDEGCISTTMVDYYGMPSSGVKAWPGRNVLNNLTVEQKALAVEGSMKVDICTTLGTGFDQDRFIPFVTMHEFEALLFSDPERFAQAIGAAGKSDEFQDIRDEFQTPEEINDSPTTAPSKRVELLVPGYQKLTLGILAAKSIGLNAMRQECPGFERWLKRLENCL